MPRMGSPSGRMKQAKGGPADTVESEDVLRVL
jgi:hypothetical protein